MPEESNTSLLQQLLEFGNTQPQMSTPTNYLPLNTGAAPIGNTGSIFDSFLQQKDINGATSGGWGSAGMGALQGLGSMYLGMKNYGLQKDQLAFGKEQFNKNYGAQRTMTNNNVNARNEANRAALGTKYASSYKPLDLVA